MRAWAAGDTGPGRKVWSTLADLGVTALLVPEKYDGIDAHPVDLVVAAERLGYWGVPGPVTESVAVAPVLLADDERCGALAAGELIATVALPPHVPRAVDADSAGLILVAGDGEVQRRRAPATSTSPSTRPQAVRRHRVRRRAEGRHRNVPSSSACWPPPHSWSARARRCWTPRWTTRSSAASSAGSSGPIRRSSTSSPTCTSRVELARPLVYGAALSLATAHADTARDVSAAKVAAADAALLAARSALQTHGAIGFTQEHDLSLLLLRVQALRSAWGDPTCAPRRVLEAL